MKVLRYISVTLGFLLLLFSLLLMCLNGVALNLENYRTLYEKYDRFSATGMDEDELMRVTDHTLKYMLGQEPEFNMTGTINGQEQTVFSQRETEHMVDVQKLFLLARGVMWGSLAAGLALVLLPMIKWRRRGKLLSVGYLIGSGAFVVFLAAIFIFIAQDFNAFWTQFHHLFFTNDLWLLNPLEDMLIVMFPGEFFMDLCIRIFGIFGILMVSCMLVSVVSLCIMRARRVKEIA